jgi:hypothetical protein
MLTLITISILATPSRVIYIPNTTYNGLGVLHLDVDNYFIQGKKGTTESEFGLTMQFLPFKKIKFEGSLDYKANLDSPIYLAGKFVIPMDTFPNLALGIYNIGVTSETLKPIYYFLFSKKFDNAGKFLIGAYLGDKGQLRDNDGELDNKGLLLGYEVYLSPLSNNLYFGADYFMGENIMSAVSLGIGWKFAKNVMIKFSYHIKLRKQSNNLLGLQININAF